MTQPALSPEQLEAIQGILSQASDLSSGSRLAFSGPFRIHLSPARANPFRHVELAGLEILELGGGCGGLSRFLAERASKLVVVETDAGARAVMQQRLGAATNVTLAADVAEAGGAFDLIVLMEAPGGETTADFDRRLAAVKGRLRPGGRLAIGVNNRLGLGAWTGQPDLRDGKYFSGVAGGLEPNSWRSRQEWLVFLAAQGWSVREEYLLSPEVWMPSCVLREELLRRDAALAADLFCHQGFAHPTLPSFPLLPPQLLAESVGRAGLLAEFAPAYLWFLGEGKTEIENPDPEVLGWHYASERRPETWTRFYLRAGVVWVSKVANGGSPASDRVRWRGEVDQEALRGERWRQRLIRFAYFETGRCEDEIFALLDELRGQFSAGPDHLQGKALDAILTNAVWSDGQTRVFDLEWELQDDLPVTWWVLRNVLALVPNLETIGRGLGVRTLADLYLHLCQRLGLESSLERDVTREAELQASLVGGPAEDIAEVLRQVLGRSLRGAIFPPRDPKRIAFWQGDQGPLLRAFENQEQALDAVGKLGEGLTWLSGAVAGQQRSLESIDAALRWLAAKVAEK